MVGADQHCGATKTANQGCQLLIHPGKAGLLPPLTFQGTALWAPKRTAGGGETGPVGPGVPIGHVGFANVEENKQRLTRLSSPDPLLDPGQLTLQTPGITCEMKELPGWQKCAAE